MKKAFIAFLCELPTIKAIGWSVLTGLTGTLIMAGFFYNIMSLVTLSYMLPLVVGFNAAISGYMLIERDAETIHHKRSMSVAVGTVIGMLSVVALNALALRMGGFYLLSAFQSLATLFIGMLGGWSGGLLAIAYKRLGTADRP